MLYKKSATARQQIKKPCSQARLSIVGVEDGTRTHDTWNHNPVL